MAAYFSIRTMKRILPYATGLSGEAPGVPARVAEHLRARVERVREWVA